MHYVNISMYIVCLDKINHISNNCVILFFTFCFIKHVTYFFILIFEFNRYDPIREKIWFQYGLSIHTFILQLLVMINCIFLINNVLGFQQQLTPQYIVLCCDINWFCYFMIAKIVHSMLSEYQKCRNGSELILCLVRGIQGRRGVSGNSYPILSISFILKLHCGFIKMHSISPVVKISELTKSS